MGNTSCVLGVQTEKRVYFCGEKVQGKVFLSVNDQDGIVAQTLNIHFSGKELGLVHYTEERRDNDDGGTLNEDRYEQNEMVILDCDVPLNTPVGSLFQPGQYEFPFQFIVPQSLPSSMFCKYGQSKCEVRYEMRAYLSKNDRSSTINPFNSNTVSSKPLVLKIFGGNSPVSPYNGPIHFPGYNHAVRNCCCCYRGSMDLRASIDGAEFAPNQQRKLSFELKNSSRVAVENVTVELIERVHWRPRFHEEAQEFILVRHAIDGRSHNNWMSMEQRIENTVQEYMSLSPTSRGAMDSSYDVPLHIPNGSRDSYDGRMIQVEHFVRVKVVTRGCCVSNPETTVDINITRPSQVFTSTDESTPMPSAPYMDEDQPIVEATVLPADWSPQTSDLVTVPLATIVSTSPAGGGSDGPYSSPKSSAGNYNMM